MRPCDTLSRRETEVLRLLCAGKCNAAIADELGITSNTVRRHNYNLFNKLGVDNRIEAARTGLRLAFWNRRAK